MVSVISIFHTECNIVFLKLVKIQPAKMGHRSRRNEAMRRGMKLKLTRIDIYTGAIHDFEQKKKTIRLHISPNFHKI